MRIDLLGGFRAVSNGTAATIRSADLQALIAYLVLHRASPQPRRRLAIVLWPDATEAQAYSRLRKSLHRLRTIWPAPHRIIDVDDGWVQWCPDSMCVVDVALFEESVSRSSSLEAVRAGVALYRGDLLPDCYADWIVPERDRLRALYLAALRTLVALHEDAGDVLQAIVCTEQLVRAEPLDEDAHSRLMRLHAAAGDRVGALRAYRAYQTVLDRELGIEPDGSMRDLYERLRTAPLGGRRSPRPGAARPQTLPTQPTRFIGREREVERIVGLVQPQSAALGHEARGGSATRSRFLTLKGAGGCGKTRLALEVGARIIKAGTFEDGATWIDLSDLTDPTLVPQEVASALGLREQPGRSSTEGLIDYLRSRHLLLIVDNCEHLIDACAELLGLVLSGCHGVHILATSRGSLHVAGEVVWPVTGLALPRSEQRGRRHGLRRIAESESVRLFVERATAALPTFRLSSENALNVADLCIRLDGIPLAIEMAAARVPALGLVQIADRLSQGNQFLTHAVRGVRSRHRTLRATMDWSYDLLSEKERTLLDRLSVFAAGFTLGAVEAICADSDGGVSTHDAARRIPESEVLELLSNLLDRSLVMTANSGDSADARYRLLETGRQYAAEHLRYRGDEWAQIRRRHAEYYLRVVESAAPRPMGSEASQGAALIQREYENLRVAMSWGLAADGDTELSLRIAGALASYWYLRRMISEGRRWLTECLAATERARPSTSRARALFGCGLLAMAESNFPESRARFEESIALWTDLGDSGGRAYALSALGRIAWGEDKFEEWDAHGEESTRLLREESDLWGLAWALTGWGYMGNAMTAVATSIDRLEESCRIWRDLGDSWGLALSLNNQGEALRMQGNHRRAVATYEESLRLHRALGDRGTAGTVAHNLAHSRLNLGDYDAARALFREALDVAADIGNRSAAGAALVGLGCVAAACGSPESAILMLSAGQAQIEAVGTRLDPIDQAERDRALAAARAELDDGEFERLWTEGRAPTIPPAAELSIGSRQRSQRVKKQPGGLTARQTDVAALIAAGKSNSAIADRLGIDPKTAEAHVSRILRKLGYSSRAQIAAWAVAAGVAASPTNHPAASPQDHSS